MELKDNHSHKGKILIANPFLQDPIFERSVILMVEHNDEGAMGFILNQPTGITIGEAFKQIKSCEFPVYYGGPIDNDILFYLHSMGDKTSNSIKISDNLYWGGDFSEICYRFFSYKNMSLCENLLFLLTLNIFVTSPNKLM